MYKTSMALVWERSRVDWGLVPFTQIKGLFRSRENAEKVAAQLQEFAPGDVDYIVVDLPVQE
jgi:hypothetical protein